jgi:ribosome assembly protein 1
MGRLTGEVIKTTRDSIKAGFLDWSPRIMLAMYSCEIQASTDVLGKVYAVLTRRRGTILSEVLSEVGGASTTGNQTFTISALLPVAESFGFSDEIRKKSSGSASPQLRFTGFEMLDEDPFWVPFTVVSANLTLSLCTRLLFARPSLLLHCATFLTFMRSF